MKAGSSGLHPGDLTEPRGV